MKSIPLIVSIDNRIDLLPYHAAYYSRLGFRTFIYALWNGKDNPLFFKIPYVWDLGAGKECEMHIRPSIVCGYDHYNGPAETPGINTIRMEFAKHEDWYCVADLDEFYWWGGLNLQQMIELLERGDYLALHGTFYDRVSRDGSFPDIPPFVKGKTTLDDLFPCVADLPKISQGNENKISLARLTGIRVGHHWATLPPSKVLNNSMQVHHFKWNADVLNYLRDMGASLTAQNLEYAVEYRRHHAFFQQPDWIKDPRLNTREAVRIGI